MAKEGSTVSGLMDSFATAISISLQHGVPLRVLCEKFAHTRFEPSGWTGNPEIGYAKSIMDYIFRWIQIRFLSGTQLDLFAGLTPHPSVPVEGTVTAPGNTVSIGSAETPELPLAGATETPSTHNTVSAAISSLASDVTPQTLLQREARAAGQQVSISDQDIFNNAPGKTKSALRRSMASHAGLDGSQRLLRQRSEDHRERAGSRHLPRRRRDEGYVRDGRLTELRDLRSNYDTVRLVLPLHVVRQHLRLQLAGSKYHSIEQEGRGMMEHHHASAFLFVRDT